MNKKQRKQIMESLSTEEIDRLGNLCSKKGFFSPVGVATTILSLAAILILFIYAKNNEVSRDFIMKYMMVILFFEIAGIAWSLLVTGQRAVDKELENIQQKFEPYKK